MMPRGTGYVALDGSGDRIPYDEESVKLHNRAMEIVSIGAGVAGRDGKKVPRKSYGDALKQARAEAAAEKTAKEAAATGKGRAQFGEDPRTPVWNGSVAVSDRADAILKENEWPLSRFGEALRQARAEDRDRWGR
jgi:hypothetical protein